jgi:tripartite-type tricarboxylate transporter receptor subunit TctC
VHKIFRLITTCILVAVCVSDRGEAQTWPAKPVKIISPFAPGGSSDTLGRILADQLSRKFNRQFFVENRGGSGGLIGSAAIAAAEPDGYTLGITSIGSHVIAPSTNANAGFDPVRDFAHIAYLGGPPIVIVVHPSLGVRSFADLRTAAKASQPFVYLSPGPGTLGQLLAELWGQRDDVKLSHVAYKGSGQAINDVIAGHVKMGSITWIGALGAMRGGLVTPLAVSSVERMPEFPDVPTLKELGYPELVASTWFGFAGPAKLPLDMVQNLNVAIAEILSLPEVRARLDVEGVELQRMSPEALAKFVASENAKWGPIARAAGR